MVGAYLRGRARRYVDKSRENGAIPQLVVRGILARELALACRLEQG